MLDTASGDTADRIKRSLLGDAAILLGVRWTMEISIVETHGNLYAFGINNRITASEKTIRNALGDLQQHLGILRGTSHSSSEDLINYKLCKEKWKVPEHVTESYSGMEPSEHPETSMQLKRKRF